MNLRIPFRLIPFPIESFSSLLAQSDEQLSKIGARRMVADKKPGYPCRVSLVDAEIGEEVLLLPFTHLDAVTPYRSSGPIFVRLNAQTAELETNEIPEMLRFRLLSVRAYDADDMMVRAEVLQGSELEEYIWRFFGDPRVAFLHIHNAQPGCYNCRVQRA